MSVELTAPEKSFLEFQKHKNSDELELNFDLYWLHTCPLPQSEVYNSMVKSAMIHGFVFMSEYRDLRQPAYKITFYKYKPFDFLGKGTNLDQKLLIGA